MHTFAAKFDDIVHADDLPAPFDASQRCEYSIETESLPDEWGGWCCYRPVWNGNERCIWHAEEPIKRSSDLHKAQKYERTWPQRFGEVDLTRRLDHAYLRNYEVDENRQEDHFQQPLSFSSCTMFGSNFYHSDFSQSSFRNVRLNGSNFEESVCRFTLFQGCDLSGTDFKYANLENARVLRQSIQNADWIGINLKDANLHDSDLNCSNLRLAELNGTRLTQATMEGCNLEEAELENADLRDVDLRNAKFYETLVRNVRINEGTEFGDTSIYEQEADMDASISQDSGSRTELGGVRSAVERFGNRCRNRTDDADSLQSSIRVYRLYQRLLREASLPEDIRLFRIREKHARRKLALSESQYLQWLKLSFDRWVMLYGESPKRVIGASVGVISIFAVLYSLIGGLEPTPSSAGQFLYFSVATFTTLVYGNIRPAKETTQLLASLEAFLGALLLALLVFVLGRRATW
ncbi:pentapeptide repeat-containing protein [Natronoarchaeum rubrum]|uniref:pentapeptide repeat-containing protein n=1 Tax=Natronoarchaeum rubrum TaxID=755311 RepID=UPI002111C5DD|nr:pentapeptide repeat-containing protein [Natronoarchaeum rubrum]